MSFATYFYLDLEPVCVLTSSSRDNTKRHCTRESSFYWNALLKGGGYGEEWVMDRRCHAVAVKGTHKHPWTTPFYCSLFSGRFPTSKGTLPALALGTPSPLSGSISSSSEAAGERMVREPLTGTSDSKPSVADPITCPAQAKPRRLTTCMSWTRVTRTSTSGRSTL